MLTLQGLPPFYFFILFEAFMYNAAIIGGILRLLYQCTMYGFTFVITNNLKMCCSGIDAVLVGGHPVNTHS